MYDISFKRARIKKIDKRRSGVEFVTINISGKGSSRAINYTPLTGNVNTGDRVIVNTTAVDLSLGTGGYHFICVDLDNNFCKNNKITPERTAGHIMKLKYTPFQLRTLSVEERDSPYHDLINSFNDLAGAPVVIIPLHSLLAPAAVSYKHFYPEHRVVYIMTEGGSLALGFSNLVGELKEKGYIDAAVTIGNAYGGDYEAVNIFTGLAAARAVSKADLIIAGMGPGITGTATRLGYSGVENAFIYQAVKILRGKAIIIPRVSLAEKRKRHYGISHHTITLLKDLIGEKTEIIFPDNEVIK
ncbi:MAG: DUF3866 family protein, partial [Halanaerobiales bacterium]